MRKLLQVVGWLLLLLLAVGCGTASEETAVPDQPADTVETESKTVEAKPQLIEFYADW